MKIVLFDCINKDEGIENFSSSIFFPHSNFIKTGTVKSMPTCVSHNWFLSLYVCTWQLAHLVTKILNKYYPHKWASMEA